MQFGSTFSPIRADTKPNTACLVDGWQHVHVSLKA